MPLRITRRTQPAAFNPASRDFERGVEFGLLFTRVKYTGHAEMAVHADLAGSAIRLAEAYEVPFSASPHEHGRQCWEESTTGRGGCRDGEDWLDVRLGEAGQPYTSKSSAR